MYTFDKLDIISTLKELNLNQSDLDIVLDKIRNTGALTFTHDKDDVKSLILNIIENGR